LSSATLPPAPVRPAHVSVYVAPAVIRRRELEVHARRAGTGERDGPRGGGQLAVRGGLRGRDRLIEGERYRAARIEHVRVHAPHALHAEWLVHERELERPRALAEIPGERDVVARRGRQLLIGIEDEGLAILPVALVPERGRDHDVALRHGEAHHLGWDHRLVEADDDRLGLLDRALRRVRHDLHVVVNPATSAGGSGGGEGEQEQRAHTHHAARTASAMPAGSRERAGG
jgi:hypothetical protein